MYLICNVVTFDPKQKVEIGTIPMVTELRVNFATIMSYQEMPESDLLYMKGIRTICAVINGKHLMIQEGTATLDAMLLQTAAVAKLSNMEN